MARSMFGSVEQSASGRWRGRYRRRGKAYYTSSRRTKRQAQEDLARVHARILAGDWEPPATSRTRAPQARTVQAWYEEWYARQERAGRSPNSLRAYRSIFKVHILPRFGELTLTEVSADACRTMYEEILASRSEATAKNAIRSFSACMGAAVEEKLLPANPVKVKGAMSKPWRKQGFQMLSAKELERLLEAMPDDTRAAGALGSWCALRYGEIAALTRDDVDLEQGEVSVTKSVKRAPNGALSVGLTKSRAGIRRVSIPPQAMPILEEHMRRYVAEPGSSLLFFRPRGPNGFLSDRVVRRDLAVAAQKVGLPPMRFHDLRHIGLTLFGRAGATTADLMARAGHSSPETVAIYQHASAERDRELAARMGGV